MLGAAGPAPTMIRLLLILLACGPDTAGLGAADGSLLAGYFPQWGVYAPHYTVRSVERSGAAARLDTLIYAFAGIGADGRAVLTDLHADCRMAYDAAASVDGVADGDGAADLRGSFNQLRKLRLIHPRLRVLLAVGGWTLSERFSAAALTPASRAAFAASCVELALDGAFAPGLRQPGIFDGIDIDWEFPGAPGAHGQAKPEDGANFTALLAELRAQLDRRGQRDGRRYLLSAALPADPGLYARIELGRIHGALDAIHLMAYDFAGAWAPRTGHLAALRATGQACGERALRDHLAAGVPAAKIMLGVPFYGRGWAGVEPGPRGDGMGQAASGPAPGPATAGIDDLQALARLPTSFLAFRDDAGGCAWRYDPAARILWMP
jgi:chitinase